MKISSFGALVCILGLWLVIGGCRSEFERVRTSNDPQKILEAAYKYYEKEDYLKAQSLFDLVLSQFRGTKEAEKLFFHYAYTYYHLRQYELASHFFESFAATFAYSKLREEADFMAAYASYRLSPVFRLDQKATVNAIEKFQEFVNSFPNSERVAQCNELIDELRAKLEAKAFANSELYYKLEDYQAAIQSFENMLIEFPDTERAEEIQFLILRSAFLYAENSVYEKKYERYEQAQKKYREFIGRYPESEYLQEVELIHDQIQKQLKFFVHDGHQN